MSNEIQAILLANVGNHDLELNDQSLLPEHEDPHYYRPSRRLGSEILADFKKYRSALALPLLEPTLNWLFDSEDVQPNQLAIFLFASDQAEGLTPRNEWLKDTKPVADVIREFCNDRWKIPKNAIRIKTIEGSPADYRNTLVFYQNVLPSIQQQISRYPGVPRIYVEVSGGTPAMTSMLILMTAETFGKDVATLYLDRESHTPYDIGISRTLFARKTREILSNQIRLYAYAVARDTLDESGQLILPDQRELALLKALLGYADRRLSFDFRRARAYLQEAAPEATGVLQSQIRAWLRELSDPDAALQIAELIHSSRIKLKHGDYADLTQRLFRFQEATFRYMAEKMGIQYSKDDGMYLKPSWVDAQTDLTDFLANYLRQTDGTFSSKETSVDARRTLNRYILGAIVDYYVQHDPQWKHWGAVTEMIHRLSGVANLRNKGIAGHGFDGIGREDLERGYRPDEGDQAVDNLINDCTTIYTTVFAQEPGPDPYATLNACCLELIGMGA